MLRQVLVEARLSLEALGACKVRAAQLDDALHGLELVGLRAGANDLTLADLPSVYKKYLMMLIALQCVDSNS